MKDSDELRNEYAIRFNDKLENASGGHVQRRLRRKVRAAALPEGSRALL